MDPAERRKGRIRTFLWTLLILAALAFGTLWFLDKIPFLPRHKAQTEQVEPVQEAVTEEVIEEPVAETTAGTEESAPAE